MLHIPVVSAGSNARVFSKLSKPLRSSLKDTLVIVDSAAFGPYWEGVYKLICSSNKQIGIYLPESVEWLLLHSLCFEDLTDLQFTLADCLSTVDYTRFFSLENYFTFLLKSCCLAKGLSDYDKGKTLDEQFLTTENLNYLLRMLPIKYTKGNSIEYTNHFGD